ncbi:MAG: exo-alpha-sialidase [Chlorobi bacterium]|nr:exo-alpha-sialidase [Chlorobiota bacterium]
MKTIITLLLFVIYSLLFSICKAQWEPDVWLTNDPAISLIPRNNARCVAVNGDNVHVVWYDEDDWEIYYKRSTDNGVSWGTDTRLTYNPSPSRNPSITSTGNVVHVVWSDSRDTTPEIYYKHSTDAGVNWGADTRLTFNFNSSQLPSICVSSQVVHVVWTGDREGNYEVYYKRSTDGGTSWGPDERLTNNSAISQISSITVSGQVVHVVWHDNRDGNWEIYYKRNPTGNPIGLINIGTEIPSHFSLHQNYPNPFNPVTKIRFAIPNVGTVPRTVRLIIYDMLGGEVTTLINEELNPGTYEVDWDASNYPSGVYYYQLTVNSEQLTQYADTKKMVLIK